MTPVDLAVVIPTFNSGRTLQRCLNSVLSQEPPPAEVVVVDDLETFDNTRLIADAAGACLIISPAKMAESRNLGVNHTASKLLLSLDSDMCLPAGLIKALVEALLSSNMAAATIAEVSVGTTYWARCRAIDKISVELTGHGRSLRAFTRDLFNRVGGYDVKLEAGEDADFHRRAIAIGARVIHVASPQILHDEGHLRLTSVARKKYGYGRSLGAFEAKGNSGLGGGYMRRILAGAVASVTRDPMALPGFLVLKATDAAAGAVGRWADGLRIK